MAADCEFVGMLPANRIGDASAILPELARCHVYAITTRPRSVVRSFDSDAAAIRMEFEANSGLPDEVQLEIDFENPFGRQVGLEMYPPGSRGAFTSSGGDVLAEFSTSQLIADRVASMLSREGWNPDEVHAEFLDLSVEYVGKALGSEDAPRDALTRLVSHSTLQQILADVLASRPQLEVWVCLFDFRSYSTIGSMGLWNAEMDLEEDGPYLEGIYDASPIELDQIVSLAEGALIRYFKPKYNRQMKENFPATTHTTYREAFLRDFAAVGFQLETTPLKCRLRSSEIRPSFVHAPMFRLSHDENRGAFLDFWADEGGQESAVYIAPR